MKKLLLILLCLPMIGFGQVDKIIFSSGDTIYVKVIEVGDKANEGLFLKTMNTGCAIFFILIETL